MYDLVNNLANYVIDLDQKDVLGPLEKTIICNTGSKGKMFQVAKHYLFNEENQDINDINY